jgi:chromosome partitioning protein
VTCIERSGDLEFALVDIAKKWEIVVVDVAGRDSSDLRGALMMSNTVLVPTSSAQTELEATAGFSPLLRRAAGFNPDMRSLVVLNRLSTHSRSMDAENARAALGSVPGLSIAKAELRSRLAYDRATILGLGVLEYSDEKAKSEFAELFAEVIDG